MGVGFEASKYFTACLDEIPLTSKTNLYNLLNLFSGNA
jgi:hypothetical protein